jgi:tRNA dimethylallyltransferase
MVKANKRYAKKQLTWFRHQLTNVKWYSYSYQNFNEVIQAVINDLQNLFK